MTEAEIVAFLIALAESKEARDLLLKLISGGPVTEDDATKAVLTLEMAASNLQMRREFGLR